jgi:hypothetical protein
MATDCPFATLGLEPGADPISIRRAFRTAAQLTHPDRGGDPAQFQLVMAAMSTLRDQGLVERELAAAMPTWSAPTPRTTARVMNPYQVMMAGLDDVAGLDPLPVTPPKRQTRNGRLFASILDQQLRAS